MKNTEFKKQLLLKFAKNEASEQELEALHHLWTHGEINDQMPEVMDEVWSNLEFDTEKPKTNVRKLKYRRWA